MYVQIHVCTVQYVPVLQRIKIYKIVSKNIIQKYFRRREQSDGQILFGKHRVEEVAGAVLTA